MCSVRATCFPMRRERKYTPTDAPKEKLFALRDFLGFERNVIVQGTCHGADNRALVDALRSSAGRARGVATVSREVTDTQLAELHDAGVRGVRFNFVKRLVDVTPPEVLHEIARRIAPLGWHVVVYFEAADLPELEPFFASLPTRVVVDHMGRPDVRQPVRRLRVRALRALHARARQRVVEGQWRGAFVRERAAGLPGLRAIRAPHRRNVSRPCSLGHGLAASEHEIPHAR